MNIDSALDCLFNITDIKAKGRTCRYQQPCTDACYSSQKYTFICLERSGLNVKCWHILTVSCFLFGWRRFLIPGSHE